MCTHGLTFGYSCHSPRRHTGTQAKHGGFSFLELVVTLMAMTMLLIIGLPSLRDTMLRSSLVAQSNELTFALARARSEALRLNHEIQFCPTSGCAKVGKDTGESAVLSKIIQGWQGWMIVDKSDGNAVLYQGTFPKSKDVSVCGPSILFRPSGLLESVPDLSNRLGVVFPTLYVSSPNQCRHLQLFGAGKVRAVLADGACTVKGSNNATYTCSSTAGP